MSFQDRVLNCASVAVCHVVVTDCNEAVSGDLQWLKICTNFRENQSFQKLKLADTENVIFLLKRVSKKQKKCKKKD
jgi:hypothetical protein